MVRVENEYGAFGIDKPYISEIRDMVKQAGFTGVPLFQCDWNSNFENNALDDFTYNKTLQKIIESYRVDAEIKKLIKQMKRPATR